MNEPSDKTERFAELPESIKAGTGSTAKNRSKPNVINRPIQLVAGEKYSDFRILRLVGQGAFADVYLAFQETMQRLVALKTSVQGSAEPQTLSQLDHRNIIRVFDQRTHDDPQMVMLYMQFVGGGTLADVIERTREMPLNKRSGARIIESVEFQLRRNGTVDTLATHAEHQLSGFDWPTAVAWIGSQIAEGLDYAHRRGVLHRDVKPANVLLAPDGTPRLADFNVSHTSRAGPVGAAAHFGGSLAYMSLEQLQAADPQHLRTADQLDGRSDLYSLGVVLWELLHGDRPRPVRGVPQSFEDALAMETKARHQQLPPEPESSADVRLRVLDRALRSCLKPDPAERPQSGEELARSLRLVMNPRAALRLLPVRPKWRERLAQLPTGLLLLLAALIPNAAAAVFNTVYNGGQIVSKYPELWPRFVQITALINLVLFPLGITIVARRVVRFHSEMAKWREHSSGSMKTQNTDTKKMWLIGHEIALLCGTLWLIAGIVFPILLMTFHRSFAWQDALHFFSSLTISGGIVMTYPFLAITLLNLRVVYPRLAIESLRDPAFSNWTARIRWLARFYLLIAAAVPLVALTLLVLLDNSPQGILLATILITGLGFAASFLAVQEIDNFSEELKPIMMNKSETESSG